MGIEVELPDGSIVEFPDGTDNATMERALSQYHAPSAAPAADFSDVQGGYSVAPSKPQRTTAQRLARDVGGLGLRNIVEGTADLAGIFYDPIADGVNWLGEKGPTTKSLITGQPERHFPRQAKARDISDMALSALGVPKPENAQERVAGDVGRALTGQALTFGAGGLLNAGRSVSAASSGGGLRQAIADFLLMQPTGQTVATVTGSSAAGGAREAGASPGLAALAGLAGGFAPAALGAATGATLRGLIRGGSGERTGQVANDFRTIGADASVGQATGNRLIQAAENTLAGFPASEGVMGRFIDRQGEQMRTGLGLQADRLSPAKSGEDAGRAIVEGITGPGGYKEATRAEVSNLYKSLDALIDPQRRVGVEGTAKAMKDLNPTIPGAPNLSKLFQNSRIKGMEEALKRDRTGAQAAATRPEVAAEAEALRSSLKQKATEIAELNQKNAAEVARRNQVRRSLGQQELPNVEYPAIGKAEIDDQVAKLLKERADGLMPYESVKKLRTLVGDELDNAGLLSDVPPSKFRALYAAISKDMQAAAEASGSAATEAWRKADAANRRMMDTMEQVRHIVDRKGGPEKVFAAAMSGTKDGATTLRTLMDVLPQSGQRAVSSAVLRRLGMVPPNAQNAAGDVFRAGTFLTNWNRLSTEARTVLFKRYGEGFAKDMDRIAAVANNIKSGSSIYANPSGTGNKLLSIGYFGALASSLFSTNPAAIAATVGGGAIANGLARVLTSPKAVNWLAKSTRLPRGAALTSLRLLATGSEDPGVLALQQLVASAEHRNEENDDANGYGKQH